MRPPRTALGLAALTLAAVAGTVAADTGVAATGGETCHGQPATRVGAPGADLRGTDGPDVIVTNGAARVYAGGGDDLVCVTGGAGLDQVSVDADDGHDIVDASASGARATFAHLGGGDDVHTGGPRGDFVEASDPWQSPPGQGADTVATGGGDDHVVTGGAPRQPDHDDIDLGPGSDTAELEGPVGPALPIQGGTGTDELEFGRSTMRRAWTVDNATGRATYDGAPVATWSAFEAFLLAPWGRWAAPSFVGGDGAEAVYSTVPLTSVELAGGDDRLRLHLHTRRLVDDASYAGGDGVDTFVLNAEAGDRTRRVDLDLVAGQLLFRPEEQPVRATIDAFERHRLSARRLHVLGTAETDQLLFHGCHGAVAAGPGDDLLKAIFVPDAECGDLDDEVDLVARGGSGDDTLLGGLLPDILVGGPGNDVADGGRDADRCVAETERRCER